MEKRTLMEVLEQREVSMELVRGYYFVTSNWFEKLKIRYEFLWYLPNFKSVDKRLKEEWYEFVATEEFEEAKKQKFENRTWISKGEKKCAEYLFQMEWLSGTWPQETVDIELTSLGGIEITGKNPTIGPFEIGVLLELNIFKKENEKEAQKVLDAVPVVFMRGVELRRANRIKHNLEEKHGAIITLIPHKEP